jgi:predicted dehydrogenase
MSRGCIVPTLPDIAFISLGFPSGTIAHVELSWLAPSKLRRTAVVGSERMVVYDDTSSEPVRIFDSGVDIADPESFGEYQLSYRTGDIVSPHVEPVEPIYRQMEDFCRAVRERAEPRSSAQLGLEVVKAIEAVDDSFAGHGRAAAISSGT